MSEIPASVGVPAATLWTRRASTVLSGPAAVVSFTGLSDLAYRVTVSAGWTAVGGNLYLLCNNDAGGNYDVQYDYAHGVVNGRGVGATEFQITRGGVGATSSGANGCIAFVQKGLANQHAGLLAAMIGDTTGAGAIMGGVTSGRWKNTAALVTRLDITLSAVDTLVAGSTFTVEGML